MNNKDYLWQEQNSITTAKEIFSLLPWLNEEEKETIRHNLRMMKMKITPFALSLMQKDENGIIEKDDPILKQFVPYKRKLKKFPNMYWENEEDIGNGYQDKYNGSRIIWRMTASCSVYCNAYCFEAMRTLSKTQHIKTQIDLLHFKEVLKEYEGTGLQEVILSGGDVMTFSRLKLKTYLQAIRDILGNEVLIRINTRAIVFNPFILDEIMVALLEEFEVTLGVHISHPNEISEELRNRLSKTYIKRFLQFPLLAGVNSTRPVLKKLIVDAYQKLGLTPKYMYHTMPETVFHEMRVPFLQALMLARGICNFDTPSVIRPQFVVVNGEYGKFIPDLNKTNFEIVNGGIKYKTWYGGWYGGSAFYPTPI